MWLSFSPDLKHWGGYALVLEARRGAWWDTGKIGLSPPPIETPEGWLIIYHGVRHTASGAIYRVGLALLDLEDPTRCAAPAGSSARRTPRAPGCRKWYSPRPDGRPRQRYHIYGGADSCVALATAYPHVARLAARIWQRSRVSQKR
jgi:predicted GH43/DUF377 family glycosyl hydrolase